MKITSKTKKSVTSTTAIEANDKAEAIKYVKCAIDSLGKSAKSGDKASREAIANLSVVLFDIQNK